MIEPLSGTFIKDKLPVFTQAVQKELGSILQRKYEVIDHNIPADIEQAAQEIVKGKTTDEAKAKALYDWVGTRIQYDYGKVDDYEQKGIWHEQTPQNTFDTRKGVCIDYARLYAVMARSQGLDVKVVTGLGYNGQEAMVPTRGMRYMYQIPKAGFRLIRHGRSVETGLIHRTLRILT